VAARADEGILHAVLCSQLCYGTSPPSSGRHYPPPNWAAFKVYDAPVPWGFLVHSLEHGAVVVVYNCPGGCPADEIAAARSWAAAVQDPLGCQPPRVILAPDPTLDVPWAAAAWGWTLRAAAFDAAAFQAFYTEHAANTAEDFCNDGVDRSGFGWCP
jgi:hypothetical protein